MSNIAYKTTIPSRYIAARLSPARLYRPLALSRVPAGFPSPAEEYTDRSLDLNEHMIKSAPSTFFYNVSGHSMRRAGIFDGDLLVVDRAIEPKHGDIVIAVVEGEITCKRLFNRGGVRELRAENPAYPSIIPHPERGFEIEGVVTFCIKGLHNVRTR